MPWVAARNGKVDVVYYGSTAASPNDTSAVWSVLASRTGRLHVISATGCNWAIPVSPGHEVLLPY